LGDIWSENLFYKYIKQSYFLTVGHMEKIASRLSYGSSKEKLKTQFLIKQISYAISPTNFFFTNPEIMEEFCRTSGKSIIKGLDNLREDLEKNTDIFSIKTTPGNLKLGKDIAHTRGEVVFRNELLELLHYYPQTQEQYEIPLLIIPPWINKYYILDLSERNSYVNWCVQQGYGVFIVSWVNPTGKVLGSTFEDYLICGALEALNFVRKYTKQHAVATVGYCLGGTLLAMLLAYLKGTDHSSYIASATMLTTLIDFSDCGEFSVFIDEKSLDALDQHLEDLGYMDGKEMLLSFSLLRANDMIWHFYINNYLLGREPFPFDILQWNADSTRMPGKMHSFYLRNMYLNNKLKKPGALVINNVPIDVSAIDRDCYFFATSEDHIVPWRGCFRGLKLLRCNKKFVLGGSGHVAGVINPPAAKKYHFYENNILDQSADKWLAQAVRQDGSWWGNWHKWQSNYIGRRVAPYIPLSDSALGKAPGTYVKKK
jgi:polyhydroxyalkanoate synthase